MADITYYISQYTGNDANDGSTIALALQTSAGLKAKFVIDRDAGVLNNKSVDFIFLGGEYTYLDNFSFLNLTSQDVRFILANDATILPRTTGSPVGYSISWGGKHGFCQVLGGTIAEVNNQIPTAYNISFKDCKITGASSGGESQSSAEGIVAKRDVINASKELVLLYNASSVVNNSTFINQYVKLFSDSSKITKNSYFDSCYVTDLSTSTTVSPLQNITLYNTYVRFGTSDTYTLATSASQLRAQRDAALGLTTPANWFNEFVFSSIALNNYNFPTSETSYILNRHIGAHRYAISQATPEANANLTDMGGYYVTTAATSIVYTLELPQGRNIRRAILHINRTGANEQLGTNGQVELSIETSHDGVTYGSATTYLSGIDSSTLDYDFMGVGAKKVRITASNTGGFGEIQYLGATVETNTLEDRLSQTDLRTLYAAGTIPVNVLSLQNKSNLLTLADFTQTDPDKQFLLSPSGGLVSPAGNSYMTSSSALTLSSTYSVQLTFKAAYSASTQVFFAHRNNVSIAPYQIFVGASSPTTFTLTVNYRDSVGVIKALNKTLLKFDDIYTVSVVFDATKLVYSLYINNDTRLNSSVLLADVAIMSQDMILGATSFGTYTGKITAGSTIYNLKYYSGRALTFSEHKQLKLTDQHNHKYLRG